MRELNEIWNLNFLENHVQHAAESFHAHSIVLYKSSTFVSPLIILRNYREMKTQNESTMLDTNFPAPWWKFFNFPAPSARLFFPDGIPIELGMKGNEEDPAISSPR